MNICGCFRRLDLFVIVHAECHVVEYFSITALESRFPPDLQSMSIKHPPAFKDQLKLTLHYYSTTTLLPHTGKSTSMLLDYCFVLSFPTLSPRFMLDTYLPALATILQTLGRRKSWRSCLLTPSLSLMLCTSPVQWSPSLQLSKSASLILLKVLTLTFLFILIYLFLSCIELVLPKNLWIKILEWNKTCVLNKQLSIVSAFTVGPKLAFMALYTFFSLL